MLAQASSLAHIGATPQLVTVETDAYNGLPGMSVVGLPSKSVDEARDRIRSAIRNSDLNFPPKRITINLAPADISKTGTGYDLAIAVGLLQATQQVPTLPSTICFVAELALNGDLKPSRFSQASVLAAQEIGCSTIVIDPESAIEASLCSDLTILRPANLRALYLHLIGEQPIQPWRVPAKQASAITVADGLDLRDVKGLHVAKRALTIALAGRHNLLLVGPPGVGKSLLAYTAPSLLPPAELAEKRSIHYLYSLAQTELPTTLSGRPFRAPHHTTSAVALIGGGSQPRPGEVTLSHQGVLFLDEIAEFPRASLEALRQPLETGVVTIARASQSVTFPARFSLLATMNPCPCGYFQSAQHVCQCRATDITRYQKKLSGPLLDRFDMICWVTPQSESTANDVKSSSLVRKTIADTFAATTNPSLTPVAQNALETYIAHRNPSFRKQNQIRKIAQTIARLDQATAVTDLHIQEALYYQQSLQVIDIKPKMTLV